MNVADSEIVLGLLDRIGEADIEITGDIGTADVILVKGSRGARLDKIVAQLGQDG